VTWGANHYASRPPDSAAGILWDKREDLPPDDGSDGEYAWSNIGGSLRIFRHYWRGSIRKTEKVEAHVHINQKPIALSAYVFREHARLKPGDLVFVPFGGSGPDIPAAVAMGLRMIWCEASEEHCRIAVGKRLHAVAGEPVAAGPLFAGLT
jgi:site-specific DNA-methyltransferase (adenine-specific)